MAKAIEGEKIAAFPFTQPGITLDETAAGGNAVSENYLGGLDISSGRPVISTVNEAVGFDPLHPDRVITRGVRSVNLPDNADSNTETILPNSTTDLTAGSESES